jgi:hypothetical protein
VPLYTEAQEIIAGFIRRGGKDEAFIENEINRLLRATPESEWQGKRIDLTIAALKSFINLLPSLKLSKYQVKQTNNLQKKLRLAGVDISVRPELLLVARGNGQTSAGAIRLYFAKCSPLTEGMARYVGAILQQFALLHASPENTALNRDCLVIDVFAENISTAPRASKRLMNELIDACTEITSIWHTIGEPKSRAAYRNRNVSAPKSTHAAETREV